MAKFVYLVSSRHTPEFVATNVKTAYECLNSIIPLLEKDYLKSYVQAFRDINKESAIYECMTPTGYYTIKRFPLKQRRNAKQ